MRIDPKLSNIEDNNSSLPSNLQETDMECSPTVNTEELENLQVTCKSLCCDLEIVLETTLSSVEATLHMEFVREELNELNKLKERFDSAALKFEILAKANGAELAYIQAQRKSFHIQCRQVRAKLLNSQPEGPRSMISETTSSSVNSAFRLPKINIPVFSGKLEEWLTFRNLYLMNIHNNEEMKSPGQKHSYLSSLLSGEPLNLIKNLTLSDENYERAWKIIVNFYDDPFRQLSACLNALVKYPNMDNPRKTTLRPLISFFQEQYAGLQSIIQEQKHNSNFDALSQLLICWFLSKTNHHVRADWERELTSQRLFSNSPSFWSSWKEDVPPVNALHSRCIQSRKRGLL